MTSPQPSFLDIDEKIDKDDKDEPIDPWTPVYSPIASEFFGILLYTLLSNLMGITHGGVISYFAIAIMDGITLIGILMIFYDDVRYPHLNPAITLALMMTLDTKIILGSVLIFIQFFGAFLGALLTRAVMRSSAFIDTFVSLGMLTRNLEYRPEDDSEVFDNRFQMFVMETILTFMLTLSHIMVPKEREEVYLPISVGLTRAITSYIGFHSFSQSTNLARMLANNIIAAIFSLDDHVWRFFYIFVFAALIGPVISAGVYWILRYSRINRANVESRKVSTS